VRYFFEGPIDYEITQHYFEKFHNALESEAMTSFREAVTGRATVLGADQLDHPKFFNSALYNEIWKPQHLKTRIEAIIRRPDATPVGSLVLYRGPGDKKFTRAEEHLLESLVPYIARGVLAVPTQLDETFAALPTSDAFACLSLDGEVTHFSDNAHRLLLLAHGEVTPIAASTPPDTKSFPALGTVWRQWRSQGGGSALCTLDLRNCWGQFIFEARNLKGSGPKPVAQLHVSIRHHELEAVAIRRAIAAFDLTPAQAHVCRLLHTAHSQVAIASILKVAPSTVTDHVRKIYDRLDVHSVTELVALVNRRAQQLASRQRQRG